MAWAFLRWTTADARRPMSKHQDEKNEEAEKYRFAIEFVLISIQLLWTKSTEQAMDTEKITNFVNEKQNTVNATKVKLSVDKKL